MFRAVTVESDYRGFRIKVGAVYVNGAWDAEVRIRRAQSDEKPHFETIKCRKATVQEAEERGALYALRWVDRQS